LAADIGTLQRFPKITGSSSLARELALTGRRFTPEESTAIGFTSRTIPGGRAGVLAEAIAVAKVIASKSPVAVTSTKRLIIRKS
jgi:delta(3,5)-delta(2,4)-dienoyl-CoA isomerase